MVAGNTHHHLLYSCASTLSQYVAFSRESRLRSPPAVAVKRALLSLLSVQRRHGPFAVYLNCS